MPVIVDSSSQCRLCIYLNNDKMTAILLEPWQMPVFVIPLVVPACGAARR